MSIEQSLYTHLTSDADIASIIGNGDSPETYRMYPLRLSQGASLPAITYQRVSGPREYDLAGPTGRARPRMQVDCWATSYSAVKDLASKVIKVLNGLNGNMGGEQVHGVTLEGERDGFEDETEYRRVILEFIIPFKE